MSTETDRTLFFDFMPMELGTIGGQKIRVQLYTVPGQVFYDATRKLVLRGADGVVFVADSQASMRESNLDSLENLRTILRINRIDPEKVALVLQYNKRDLPNVASVEEMNAYLNHGDVPVVEASAIQGTGVTQTLRAAVSRILDNLKNNVDTTLYDQPELGAPDMSARSGVTPSSAGTPKLSMKREATPASAAPSSSFSPVEAPSPFMESPFAVATESTESMEDDPFGHVAVAEPEVDVQVAADDPFEMPVVEVQEGSDPFSAPSAEVHDGAAERQNLETLLASARQVVHSLEIALEHARENERILTERQRNER